MKGGAALVLPPDEPPGTSIIRNSWSVMPRTCWVLPSSDASSSRLSVSSRGLPPPNWGGVNAVPVTFSYFHSLDFEIEYSVGLKSTSKGAEPSICSWAFVYCDGRHQETWIPSCAISMTSVTTVFWAALNGQVHLTG